MFLKAKAFDCLLIVSIRNAIVSLIYKHLLQFYSDFDFNLSYFLVCQTTQSHIIITTYTWQLFLTSLFSRLHLCKHSYGTTIFSSDKCRQTTSAVPTK